MRGLVVEKAGLSLSSALSQPVRSPGQILVRVLAAGLNPTDADLASGSIDELLESSTRAAPVRTGLEFVGEVVESDGEFEPGTRVFGYPHVAGPQKAHQEFLAVDRTCLATMPESLSSTDGASLPLAATTVLVLHRDVAPVAPGARVLVLGAAGGVGLSHVQVAKHVHGAHVTAVAGPGNAEFLGSLGADEVFDYRTTRLDELEGGFDLIVDWTTRYRFSQVEPLLASEGRFVPADPFQNAEDFVEGTESAARSGYLFAAVAGQGDLETVARWVEEGHLRPTVDSVFRLEDYEQALARLHERSKRGRVVLDLSASMS